VHAFTFRHGRVPWPAGLTLLHVYALADVARSQETAAIARGCRAATRGEPLAHVADEWLHITLCQIAMPAHTVDAGQRVALATEIGLALRGTEPCLVTVGAPARVSTGVTLDIGDDDGALAGIRDLVSAGTDAVLGPGMATGNAGPLHMTESYAYDDADDARIDAQLLAVQPRGASLLVAAVDLVDVSADQDAKTITWSPVARIPLG
jgi:hypothetical protein